MSENGHNLWLGTIRQATAADGAAIGTLYSKSGWQDHHVNWSTPGVADWWIVAEDSKEIVGAVQLCLSKPFGYIGDIVVHPAYRGKGQNGHGRLSKRLGALAYTLYLTAYAMAKQSGVEVLIGAIPQQRKGLHRFFEHVGAMHLGDCALYGRRVR